MPKKVSLDMFATYGADGSSARVRLYDWIPHIEDRAQTMVHPYLGTSDNSVATLRKDPIGLISAEIGLRRRGGAEFDRSIISRSASPFSNGEVETRIMQRSSYSVYDVDDAIMLPPQRTVKKVFSEARVFKAAARSADVVIAGNEYLAEAAGQYSNNVCIIPSCVDLAQYSRRSRLVRNGGIKVVWIGSPSTERYLEPLAGVFNELHREREISLTVISKGDRPIPGFNENVVTRIDWSRDSFSESIAHCDVGIMPLPDSPWERGKCAYKLLQYGASAIPVVGSPVGASKSALEHLGGPSPQSPGDWRDVLIHLDGLSDSELTQRGWAAYEGVSSHYSFGAWLDTWLSVVEGR